jgi:hypothetical protein
VTSHREFSEVHAVPAADMTELQKRKQPLNLAIVYVDPDAYIASIMGWLEVTTFIRAQRLGEAQVPADGITPKLTPEQLKNGGVHEIGNDALFAFCMTAALKGDKAAVDKVEAAMAESMGKEFPGSAGLWYFRAQIDAPVTLEDFVGQAGKKMLLGDIPPPPLRAKENWSAGLRFFEKARKSNFIHEIMYPLALWTRPVGPSTWRRACRSWPTSRTTCRSCARSWRRSATTRPSSPTSCTGPPPASTWSCRRNTRASCARWPAASRLGRGGSRITSTTA